MFFVHRMMLNGSSDDGFMQVVDSPEIICMEIDVVNQVLYWTNKGDSTPSYAIKKLDLTTAVVSGSWLCIRPFTMPSSPIAATGGGDSHSKHCLQAGSPWQHSVLDWDEPHHLRDWPTRGPLFYGTRVRWYGGGGAPTQLHTEPSGSLLLLWNEWYPMYSQVFCTVLTTNIKHKWILCWSLAKIKSQKPQLLYWYTGILEWHVILQNTIPYSGYISRA